jgi:hypothetical protein
MPTARLCLVRSKRLCLLTGITRLCLVTKGWEKFP